MSQIKAVIRDTAAVVVTSALAILVERYVSVKLALAIVILGSLALVWFHELHKSIWMASFIFWLNHKLLAVLISVVAMILIVASMATMKLRLPPDPKPLITRHAPINFPPTEMPIPAEKLKPKQKKPAEQPPTEQPRIVMAPSFGDLRERASGLSQEIMAYLYRHGWSRPGEPKIDRPFPAEQLPTNVQDYKVWSQRRSDYFRARFYERVVNIRDEFSQLHYRDERLDDFINEQQENENTNRRLRAAGQQTFDQPIAPLTITDVADRLLALANKIK